MTMIAPPALVGRTAPEVEAARFADAQPIADLLLRSAPDTIPISADRIRAWGPRFLVVRADDGIAATAAVHPVDRHSVELRSLAVDPDHRGHGLGARLVKCAMRVAHLADRRLLCVTLEPRFFERLGFRRLPMADVPEKPQRADEIDGRPRVALAWWPTASPVLSRTTPVPLRPGAAR